MHVAHVKLYFFSRAIPRQKFTKSVNTSEYQKSLNSKPIFWSHSARIIDKEKFEAETLVIVKKG